MSIANEDAPRVVDRLRFILRTHPDVATTMIDTRLLDTRLNRMRRALGIGLLSLTVATHGSTPTEALAAWPTDGVPVIQAGRSQLNPAMAPDGVGGVWIAWSDERAGGGESDIYARHLDVDGTPLGPVGGIPVATAAGRQETPSMAPDGQGGCIIVWQDRRERLTGSDLFMQRLSAGGAPLWHPGGQPLLVTYGDQELPRIVREQYGSWIVTWQDARYAGNTSIYAQRILANGLPSWLASGVPICRAPGAQLAPRIIADRVGGAVITWSDRRNGTDYDLFGQRLDYGGAIRWPLDGRRLAGGPGDQQAPLPALAAPSLALDETDGIYVAWSDTRSGAADVYLHHLQGDGLPAPGWAADGVTAASPALPRGDAGVVADAAGGVIVTFRESPAAGDDRIRAARFTAAGMPVWDTSGVLATPSGAARTGPSPAADGHGGVFLAWSEAAPADPGNILLQWLDEAGQAVLAPGGHPFCLAAGAQEASVSLAGPPSDLMVVWSDGRGGDVDLFGQRLSGGLGNLTLTDWPAGLAAPLVARASSDTLPDAGILPASLPGNTPTIYFNQGFHVEAPDGLPGWRTTVSVDGIELDVSDYPAGAATGEILRLNAGPYTVRGGRHTLTLRLDALSEVPETDEEDNAWSAQYVFEPRPLAAGQAERRASPPYPGDGDQPNCDGFAWDPPPGVAWAVGVGAVAPEIEETLLLYDDYAGLTDGFSLLRQASADPGDGIEIIVGDRTAPDTPVYPAIVRAEDFDRHAGTIIACETSAERLIDRFPFVRGPESLAPDRLFHVYEVYLEGGIDREFLLQRAGGTADLEMALFSASGDVVTLGAAKIASTPVDPATDAFHYLPQDSGWYPLVVYRRFAYEADDTVLYRLYGLDTQSGTPVGLADGRSLALRVTPNPVPRAGRLELDIPAPGSVTLDLFDIRGRRIRRLLDQHVSNPGRVGLTWQGDDASGRRLPAGRYLLRLDVGGRTRSLPITLLP